ncbi:hypothetical protein [Flavobacterium collinsii]|jgi:hypothetical protein|uniref:Uncharacterized protein n=1 Tax=Flavobacterium collinsii TaxID=1114861 RepID=A0ABN7ESB7_9FLAO|nr:hypothetical protein [Flavobacterium collinsii]GIQ57796.1 hypothetical protein Flavo103_09320 [Flavobacterium collinsii]CAA9203011.1 hypothetical protein FLACOL7796_04565 [Flavobacterium collinsii]
MKLSFEALKQRAELVTSEEVMNSISGGAEAGCHLTGILEVDSKIIGAKLAQAQLQ